MVEKVRGTQMTRIRTYSELITFNTFEERFKYAKLIGKVGDTTFGYDRYLNQLLYKSREWRALRNKLIIRDEACDLAFRDREIFDMIILHHLNPVSPKDIEYANTIVFDPENLICVSDRTHRAIHFGDSSLLYQVPIERELHDTAPWRK